MPMLVPFVSPLAGRLPESTGGPYPARGQPNTREPRRILVADDDPTFCECIAVVLSRSGFEVETVADGEEGWRAVRNRRFDLVITDHEMPKMTGLSLIRKIREAPMEAPCILISASLPAPESSLMPLIQPGAVLEKPFVFRSLTKVVFSLLGQDALPEAYSR